MEAVEKLCQTAESYLGRNEADGSHREIIRLYNSISPLPRGYRMSDTDPWCAAFVSAVGKAAGLGDIIYPECSCDVMAEQYRRRGLCRGSREARRGDIIMYDWNGNGTADHVGIVLSAENGEYKVIEGNISDRVGTRRIAKGSPLIKLCCSPDYPPHKSEGRVDKAEGPMAAPEKPEGGKASPLPMLYFGMRGESVRAAQLLLAGRGCGCGRWGADGDFGMDTKAAVLRYQRREALEADGIIGRETWCSLLGL